MNYYARLGKQFFISLCWVLIAIIYFSRFYKTDEKAILIIYAFLFVIYFSRAIRLLYFAVLKRPIFSANESYIFDHYEYIKYYWDDIEEVVFDENDRVEIKLYEPGKYLRKIISPLWRLRAFIIYKLSRKASIYNIDLNLLIINKGENQLFRETLNNLSV